MMKALARRLYLIWYPPLLRRSLASRDWALICSMAFLTRARTKAFLSRSWDWRAGSALALRPCVAIDVNLLRGTGQDSALLTETYQESVRWWAVSLPIGAELDISESMRLRLQGGPTVPFEHAEFYFTDGDETLLIHRTEVGGFVGLGGALRL